MKRIRDHAHAVALPRYSRKAGLLASLIVCIPGAALAAAAPSQSQATSACDRSCMSTLVSDVLRSMVAHDPYTLPLAPVYEATENAHPAALGMMTLWRTVTAAGKPDLLAIDPVAGQAFFLMRISEAGDPSVLWGRIAVADRKITQLELYINRSRGDHGFSFSADDLPANMRSWMNPPADRKVASRAQLEKLSRAAFDASDPLKVQLGRDCQFVEVGTHVIDPGLGPGFGAPPRAHPDAPLGCGWPSFRPTDLEARTIVLDPKLGMVVDAAMIRGRVYPYPYFGHMVSAFIPDDMKQAQEIQERWYKQMAREGKGPLLQPVPATGIVMQVLQFYDGKLQGMQINVHLEGPGAQSLWASH